MKALKLLIQQWLRIFAVMMCCATASQAVVPVFDHLGLQNGLSNESIKVISQDHEGYMWFGTVSGLFRYDGYQFRKIILQENLENIDVLSLFVDSNGLIWIGTKGHGLFAYNTDTGQASRVLTQPSNALEYRVYDFIEDPQQRLWIASTEGLEMIPLSSSADVIQAKSKYLHSLSVHALAIFDGKFLIGSEGALLLFDGSNGEFVEIHRFPTGQRIHTLHVDVHKKLWIGTSKGLVKFDVENAQAIQVPQLNIDDRVLSMVSEGDHLWVASLFSGLYRINISDHSSLNFTHQAQFKDSLSENNITSLFISSDHVLWAGTFVSGINKISLDTLKFGYETNTAGSFHCAQNRQVYGIYKDNHTVWLSTGNGLIAYGENRECRTYRMNPDSRSDDDTVYHSWRDDETLWISSSSGLKRLNLITDALDHLTGSPSTTAKFSFKHTDGLIYFGSLKGLSTYTPDSQTFAPIASIHAELNNAEFYAYAIDSAGTLYFATSAGLAFLNNGVLHRSELPPATLAESILTSLHIDSGDIFYLGYDAQGLIQMDAEGRLLKHLNGEQGFNRGITIKSMIADSENRSLWMGSDHGLIRYHKQSGAVNFYAPTDGINSHSFFIGSVASDLSGQLYFGNNAGFIRFDPQTIYQPEAPKHLTLTDFYLSNDRVTLNQSHESGLMLSQPINAITELKLNHKQNMIGFEFSAMQYQDPRKARFAYRISGLTDQWHDIGYDQRHLTFTNLDPGDYQLQIKAANKEGLWSEQVKTLDIKVSPAPWLSPLAYTLYTLLAIVGVMLIIRHRTASARKHAEQLETEVLNRTQEVKMQKQMLESMLDHKNQLYANITHEFRTPLTLITGPIDSIIHHAEAMPLHNELQMIKRNADRLLLMVDQLLNLSESEHKQLMNKQVQGIKPTLTMLHASFVSLAEKKNITFSCGRIHDRNILTTPQCLEIVVGNLISNAIKYTPQGGTIDLFTEFEDEKINIHVRDNGPGIADAHKDYIFDRFTRLHHEHIQGSGIGLAVVKEITTINGGSVTLKSTPGLGSTFIASFNCTNGIGEPSESHQLTKQLVSNSNTLPALVHPISPRKKRTTPQLLIIDDNLDMQTHIGNVLGQQFRCLFADCGQEGVALCLKKVPDIVICDVMMPGMDGFQVARTIRQDLRTSHIPIVLLTALNSRESRIRGWREKIDVYISKPFDAAELIVRLENILSIRQLLQQQAHTRLSSNNDISDLDLAEPDIKFIKKLKQVIKTNYADTQFYKTQMAKSMAVSERQLHRKAKALTDRSPMDLLREYRLTSAATKLAQGIQVTLVSDACGFSDMSYFAACFKRRYGMTPKKYQLLNNKKHN
ncbi:two-component regulator propeller domain-containing protein [Marinicella sp. W31]|uniref:hybrid sensor histidine kinase/response regulator transcription factor n=1 Tax=Marinicella sp. W31 TaxID=3023713 RepID=UPI003757F926